MSQPTAVDQSSAESHDDVLDINEVSVHYGGVCAVDRMSISIRRGLLYGLAGPNGSGKSTMLGAISRFVPTSGGQILFDGVDCTKTSATHMARIGLGRTFQTVRLMPQLTVIENVMLGADLRYRGKPWKQRFDAVTHGFRPNKMHEDEARSIAAACLARVGLEGMESATPAEMPYGIQRRVEIARALATEPKLLLLDEPTAGMNREERQEVTRLLEALRRDGVTQILVEHDVGMLLELTDYLFIMNTGRLIAEGDPAAVVALPIVQDAYLGTGTANAATDDAAAESVGTADV